MRMTLGFVTFAALILAPSAAYPNPSGMSPAMVGVGPHGYDWLTGAWSCRNSAPSAMGGPATTTVTVTRSANGSLSIHSAGTGFDSLGYVVYVAKTKTWWNPSVIANGDYSTESSQQTGKKTLWTGLFFDAASGKTSSIRDTYAVVDMTTFKDLSEAEVGGSWKIEANTTCTKP